MNCKFKLKQRVAALCMAAMICCSLFPAGVFAETPRADADGTFIMEQDKEAVTDDIHQTEASDPDPGEESTPKSSEAAATSQSADEDAPVETSTDYTFDGAVLYTDLPDMPTGSYMGSQGLPVATGETKIGIFAWPNDQLEESADSYLSADTLNSDDLTMTAPLLEGTDYAVVPILAQVEYPADGSSLDVVLPNEVTVLDFYGVTADEATRSRLVHSEYTETSAAVMGLYVQADADFSAKLVYTAPDGSTLTKALHVVIDRSRTMAAPFAETTDVAAYAERPTPAVTSGKITKVEKVNGTWLIWFNGEEAYCCTHGANGQPKGCPPYTYTNTSLVSADQCIPGDHYGNQYRIWGGLDQLSMELLPDTPVAFSAEDTERISLLDFCRTFYDDTQMWLIEKYPESTAAKIYLESAQALLDGAVAYAKPRGYYTYIYTPARSGWQTVALIGPEISEEETEEPKPVVQEYYASWEAPAQSASGTVDLTYGVTTDKIQLKTLEKVDGATIEIEPITKSGTIDGGSWSISPAGVQTVTTSGHTNDENYQNNGGAASASWSVHYTVSKTVDGRSGSVGPYTTKEAADAAANSERDSAVAAIQAEAQSAVNNAIASAQAQLASLQFRYDEVTIPYGFESYWGSNGSHQTITVPANSNNAYKMRNAEWSLQIKIKKTDSETGNQIAGDARYEIYQWDVVTGKYQPTGGYNTYSVQRQGDGTYAVINNAAYATNDTMRHTLYYTQRNEGRFILVETKAPAGYFGDWTDIAHPGTAGTPLGKRAYYVEITADNNNSVLWLGNGDYNADIATGDKGGTKLVTSGGVETTVTIYDSPKDASRSYTTDASGKAANEDGYTTTAADGIMKNDRTLGEISMHNMNSVMELFVLMQHRYGPQGRSQLDDIFEDLAMEKPASFAARQYGLYHMAPDKTAQSIDVSLGMRMSAFNIPSIMKICEDDTIHLEELASDKKVALFVVTPDTTTAYNFLAAVMFQQCFQILVHSADNREDHCLPRHVRFLLDEFPNIGMIPDFQILISTIRSRNIGCTLIYQSIAQLKSQYGDDWGTILENCDSELVLGGGNNPESLEFFGKQLGKRTIEVLNTTENLGAQGSFSKNYQVASRDLMTPEEIRTMPRNRCLLMISGVVPFYSYKFDLKKHPNYALVEKEGHRPFDYERRAENNFAAFLKNVQEINNIELDDDESDT